MRNAKSLIGMFCVLALAVQIYAAPIAQMDSINFASKYEADALPSATDWTLGDSGLAGDAFAVSNGELSYSTTDPVGVRYYAASAALFNPTADYTVEARLKVTAGSGDLPGLQFAVSNGSHHAYFGISTDSISLAINGVYTIIASELDNTGMNSYRVAYSAATDRFSLWREGSLISDNLDAWHSAYHSHMQFGDFSNSNAGSVSLDYLRFDTTGAYAPVPEPTTIGLVAIGALGMIRRRK